MRLLLPVLLLISIATRAEECLPKEFFAMWPARYQQEQSARYSSDLRELDEPCLYRLAQEDKTKEIFRFEWGGSLHTLKTIVVRVEVNKDGSGTAFIKQRKERGKTPKDQTKPLTKEKIDALRKVAQEFWAMPYSDDVIGLDGTGWYLEGIRDGKFHAVYRWSPHRRDKKFHRIGEYFLYKIANVKIDHDYLN